MTTKNTFYVRDGFNPHNLPVRDVKTSSFWLFSSEVSQRGSPEADVELQSPACEDGFTESSSLWGSVSDKASSPFWLSDKAEFALVKKSVSFWLFA